MERARIVRKEPKDVRSANATGSTVQVCWTRPEFGQVLGYIVKYREVENPHGQPSFLNITSDAISKCSTLVELKPWTDYEFRVYGWNRFETGQGSTVGRFGTRPDFIEKWFCPSLSVTHDQMFPMSEKSGERGGSRRTLSMSRKKEQAHHSSAGGKSVSCCLRKADLPKTVARRLRGGGLYARRPAVCVPLTRQHRTARLQWCREHHNWTEQDWACVLFSDESRFSLSSDCRRQLIWRESGTAYRPENIQEKDRYPTCSIMVWAGIMINGRTRLHVVANGTMTGQRYIDEVLLPHVRLFRCAVGDKFVFMDDNATCHRTLAVQDCLDSEGIQRLV
ncbi:transposable element Tcb2 transposase [Trichonephila clavipes]|nr:transposable element Tcb2 transposase [Trichonephila clavipes]